MATRKRRGIVFTPAQYEQNSWSGFPGLWFKWIRNTRDGHKRITGKVRNEPRHTGSGRHHHGAAAAAGGRNVRNALFAQPTAAIPAARFVAVCVRQEKK